MTNNNGSSTAILALDDSCFAPSVISTNPRKAEVLNLTLSLGSCCFRFTTLFRYLASFLPAVNRVPVLCLRIRDKNYSVRSRVLVTFVSSLFSLALGSESHCRARPNNFGSPFAASAWHDREFPKHLRFLFDSPLYEGSRKSNMRKVYHLRNG